MPSHNKEVWGPRVWRLLHRLSFYSDRKDIVAAWKRALNVLSDTIPCALCQKHMKEYLSRSPITLGLTTPGGDVRFYMIDYFYRFHNHVRLSQNGIEFPVEELENLYGSSPRQALLVEIRSIMKDLEDYWSDIPLKLFKEAFNYLISLIGSGSLN